MSTSDEPIAPKLRSVEKVKPPYPLNHFPPDFPYKLGEEIVYHLATASQPSLEGPEWERIFSVAVGAEWKPSNVGLDDIMKGVCAWGAKSVKNARPWTAKSVRLISGRNSPNYSFSISNLDAEADELGNSVLSIWNARVESLRNRFSILRTVVLIKGESLSELAVFETDTVMYPPENYAWRRNANNNLEGLEKSTQKHRFTWQPHGSQFTIVEEVPDKRLCLEIKCPPKIPRQGILKSIGFNKSWIKVIKPPR